VSAADSPPSTVLPASSAAPALARRQVSEVCSGWAAPLADAALVLTSELVTNAVRHGDGDIEMRIIRTGKVLRVEISDASPELPRSAVLDPMTMEGGRGLHIVSALATSWGVDPRDGGGGKTVWFELRAPV
jgi:anti-sigma regulatory factor (Ser/Thr protein kinase)